MCRETAYILACYDLLDGGSVVRYCDVDEKLESARNEVTIEI